MCRDVGGARILICQLCSDTNPRVILDSSVSGLNRVHLKLNSEVRENKLTSHKASLRIYIYTYRERDREMERETGLLL